MPSNLINWQTSPHTLLSPSISQNWSETTPLLVILSKDRIQIPRKLDASIKYSNLERFFLVI